MLKCLHFHSAQSLCRKHLSPQLLRVGGRTVQRVLCGGTENRRHGTCQFRDMGPDRWVSGACANGARREHESSNGPPMKTIGHSISVPAADIGLLSWINAVLTQAVVESRAWPAECRRRRD